MKNLIEEGLRGIAADYRVEQKRLRDAYGDDWHRPSHTGVLERIERRIRRATQRLPVHPAGWDLPCWCAECLADAESIEEAAA